MPLFRAAPGDGAVWLTGASTGIGEVLARKLAANGFTVYASARSQHRLEEMARDFKGPGNIVALPLDVTDKSACAAAADRIATESGKIALAIFNAGTFAPVRAFKLSHDAFEQTFRLNFFGVLNCLLPAVEKMSQAGGGQIALVSSSASYGGLPKSAAYGASKAALVNLAASLKFDLDTMNIRIQVVTPGFVDTPLSRKNDFPMPFLMPVEKAADAFIRGLGSNAFDITFPKRFTYLMKAANLLPYRWYFPLIAAMTGAGKGKRRAP